jgi:hypothetical protein
MLPLLFRGSMFETKAARPCVKRICKHSVSHKPLLFRKPMPFQELPAIPAGTRRKSTENYGKKPPRFCAFATRLRQIWSGCHRIASGYLAICTLSRRTPTETLHPHIGSPQPVPRNRPPAIGNGKPQPRNRPPATGNREPRTLQLSTRHPLFTCQKSRLPSALAAVGVTILYVYITVFPNKSRAFPSDFQFLFEGPGGMVT